MSLRTRFTLVILTTAALSAAALGGSFLVSENNHLLLEVEQSHWATARHLAHMVGETILTKDDLALINFMKEVKASNYLLEAVALNPKGIVLMHTDVSRAGKPGSTEERRATQALNEIKEPGSLWRYTVPVFRNKQRVATVLLTYDGKGVQRRMKDLLVQTVRRSTSSAAVAVLVMLGLSWGAARTLTRPILALATGARHLSKGEWDTRVPTDGPGELSDLGREFNIMATRLGELDAFKTHIMHTISHDLRNPLSAIATSAKLLREDALPERSLPLVDAVTTSVLRLRTMVNNILDGAHLKEGRLTFQFREVELRPLLEEVVRLFNPLAKDAGKILSSDWPQLPARLRADEEKLFRILLNLLANAFKFTRRGDRVTLGARPAEKGGVAFWVQDTGWGIPPEKIGGLLTSEKGGGAGMGLRIVQALVEGHGGKMEVRSVSQQGTTVEFLLPEGQP